MKLPQFPVSFYTKQTLLTAQLCPAKARPSTAPGLGVWEWSPDGCMMIVYLEYRILMKY